MKCISFLLFLTIFILQFQEHQSQSVAPIDFPSSLPYFSSVYVRYAASEISQSNFANLQNSLLTLTRTLDKSLQQIQNSTICLTEFKSTVNYSLGFEVSSSFQPGNTTFVTIQMKISLSSQISIIGFSHILFGKSISNYMQFHEVSLTTPLAYQALPSTTDYANKEFYPFIKSFVGDWTGIGPLMGQHLGFSLDYKKNTTQFVITYNIEPFGMYTSMSVVVVVLVVNRVGWGGTVQFSSLQCTNYLVSFISNSYLYAPAYYNYQQRNNMIFGFDQMVYTNTIEPYFLITLSNSGILYESNNLNSGQTDLRHFVCQDKMCPLEYPYRGIGSVNCSQCLALSQIPITNPLINQKTSNISTSTCVTIDLPKSKFAFDQNGQVSKICAYCTLCQKEYYLELGVCSLCNTSLNNCLQCTDKRTCTSCQKGYYINNGKCSKCTQAMGYCLECSNNSYCTLCRPEYIQSKGNCISCNQSIPNCNQCSTNGLQCLTCAIGFYPNNGTCEACNLAIPNCTQCISGTICSKCVTGSYFKTGSCYSCQNSMPNCLQCNSGSVCSSCSVGYYFAINSCMKCSDRVPNCAECTLNNLCTKCVSSDYFLSSNNDTCLPACQMLANCLQCSTAKVCDICQTGFYWDMSLLMCNSCNSSIGNCKQCSRASSCSVCEQKYYLDNGKCTLCSQKLSNCSTCSDANVCTTCASSQFTVYKGQCKLCSQSVQYCMACDGSFKCINCSDGYYLDSYNNRCQICSTSMPQCFKCISNSACTSCSQGYYVSNYQCKSCSSDIPNCLTCSDSQTCTSCHPFYQAKLGKCQKRCLSNIRNCLSCQVVDLANDYCTSCQKGFYPNSKVCEACSSRVANCLQCSVVGKCTSCAQEYFVQAQNTCGKCSLFIPNCIQCQDMSSCTACQAGYKPQGGTCKLDKDNLVIILCSILIPALMAVILGVIRKCCCSKSNDKQKQDSGNSNQSKNDVKMVQGQRQRKSGSLNQIQGEVVNDDVDQQQSIQGEMFHYDVFNC